MAARAEKTAWPDLLEKDGLAGGFFISQVFRQNNVRNIFACGFLIIQPRGNSHHYGSKTTVVFITYPVYVKLSSFCKSEEYENWVCFS
jgi:hypothetical protein